MRSWRWSGLRAWARPRSASRWRARSGGSSPASHSVVSATRPSSVVTGARTSARGPGRIVRALTEAGTMNPVVLLDEVDKLGADWRGDPSSALLEVLDPAQNHTFRDHYLEVDLDLSEVLFLATANVADTIPGPLLDRLEVIRLDGYTEDEKVSIAREHLLSRQLTENGLRAGRRRDRRRRAAPGRDRVHPRGRRPEPRARARQAAAQGRRSGCRRHDHAACRRRRGGHPRRPRSRQVLHPETLARTDARVSRPGSPSPGPAGTCS